MACKRFAVIFGIHNRQIRRPAENTRQPGGLLADIIIDRRRDDKLVVAQIPGVMDQRLVVFRGNDMLLALVRRSR